MLTLTPTAAEAVRHLVAASPIDDDGGIRISPGEIGPAGATLEIALVDAPEVADASLDADGAHVLLEPDVAEFLDDKVFDVEPGEAGLTFTIRGQSSFDPSSDGRPPVDDAGP